MNSIGQNYPDEVLSDIAEKIINSDKTCHSLQPDQNPEFYKNNVVDETFKAFADVEWCGLYGTLHSKSPNPLTFSPIKNNYSKTEQEIHENITNITEKCLESPTETELKLTTLKKAIQQNKSEEALNILDSLEKNELITLSDRSTYLMQVLQLVEQSVVCTSERVTEEGKKVFDSLKMRLSRKFIDLLDAMLDDIAKEEEHIVSLIKAIQATLLFDHPQKSNILAKSYCTLSLNFYENGDNEKGQAWARAFSSVNLSEVWCVKAYDQIILCVEKCFKVSKDPKLALKIHYLIDNQYGMFSVRQENLVFDILQNAFTLKDYTTCKDLLTRYQIPIKNSKLVTSFKAIELQVNKRAK